MVMRIHFTVEDLARTRIDTSPWPLLEAAFAVRRLRQPGRRGRPSPWRRRILSQLSGPDRMVFDLTPPAGYTPCFLAAPAVGSTEEQLECVRAAPRRRIHDDMTYFAARHPVPDWARRLADDPPVVQQVVDALGHIHAVTVAPYWSQLRTRTSTDRVVRSRQVLDGGIERLLATLHPTRIRWDAPVLHVRTLTDVDADVHLGGRGLLLVPSILGPDAPTFTSDVEPQPVLTYPVPVDRPIEPGRTLEPVAALLGETRAAILDAIVAQPGRTNSEVAAVVGASLSTVSEHTTVLRTAGLIATVRYRQSALQTPTETGLALLAERVPTQG